MTRDLTSVFVLAGTPDTARRLGDIVRREFEQVQATASPDETAASLVKADYSVLLISYEDLAAAKETYLGLLRSPRVIVRPCQSIVLCQKGEAGEAFELCKRRIFDNYAIDRPLYDVHRLYLTVHHAFDKLLTRTRGRVLHEHLEEVGGDVRALGRALQGLAERATDLREGSAETYGEMCERQTESIEGLREQLCSAEFVSVLPGFDETALSRHLESFKGEQMTPELERFWRCFGELFERYQREVESAKRLGVQAEARIEHFEHQRHNESIRGRILVADDDEGYQKILLRVLEGEGFEVHIVSSGAEALAVLRQVHPDLILMDYAMEGLDGATTIRTMRSMPDGGEVPIIMLTGHGRKDILNDALQAGANDFIVKPAPKEALLQRVRAQMKGKGVPPSSDGPFEGPH